MSINIANCLLSQQPFDFPRKTGRKLLALDFPLLRINQSQQVQNETTVFFHIRRNKQIGTLTDKQKYEAKILEKDARIKELGLELIIAKKVAARYPRYPIDKRHR